MPGVFNNRAEIDRFANTFFFSGLMFRIGLALVTFEQDRPFGVTLADYCFFASFLLALPVLKSELQEARGSGILLGGALIFSGSILSLWQDVDRTGLFGSLIRLVALYGLFAPLALVHSRHMRKNLVFLVSGISVNCAITIVQAAIFPGIVNAVSINPVTPDQAENIRFQGLTEFPVTLGLAAALSVLICFALVLFERRAQARWGLLLMAVVCIEGALLSGSRTFLAALLPGLAVFGLSLKKHRRTIAWSMIGLASMLGVFTYAMPGAVSLYSDRIADVGLVDYGRLAVAIQAAIAISQKPILGWGFNHFGEAGLTMLPEIGEPQGVHVTLLQYWYSAGLLGAIGFLALFVVPLRRMIRFLKRPQGYFTNMVRLGFSVYVSLFIIFSLGPYQYNRYLYIPMFIFAGFAARAQGSSEVSPDARPCRQSVRAVSGIRRSEAQINRASV